MEFPAEINYNIITSLHPYYLIPYCQTNNEIKLRCDIAVADIGQIWIWPELSLLQIRKLYPKLTFNDVVSLALVYSPIPESIKYYDRVTLFLHACRIGADPKPFLTNDVLLLSDIAMKYRRYDIIEYMLSTLGKNLRGPRYKLTQYLNLILLERGKRPYYIHPNRTELTWDILSRYFTLYTLTDIAKLIILDSKFGVLYKKSDTSYYYKLLTGKETNENNFVNYIAYHLGVSTIQQLLQEYNIEDEVYPVVNYSSLRLDRIDDFGRAYITAYEEEQIHSNEKAIDLIYGDNAGIYYVYSGKFDLYMKWKKENSFPEVNEVSYISNQVGTISMNIDFANKYELDINDILYINYDS